MNFAGCILANEQLVYFSYTRRPLWGGSAKDAR